MSTVLVFNPVTDLAGSQTDAGEVTLSWSTATRILEFINGDAELGDTSGWTNTVGTIQAAVRGQFGTVTPPEGEYIFTGNTGQASTKAHQRFSPLTYGLTIDQIDNDALQITVDWWGGTYASASTNDQPAINIIFRDSALTAISTYNSGFKTPTTAYAIPSGGDGFMRWDEYQEVTAIPANTRFIDIQLEGKRNQGSFDDSSWDDVRFSLEDSAMLPYVPGYAIYQDGILIATASANATEYVVTGLADGDYDFKIVAYDGTNFLSADSNEVGVSVVPDTNPDVTNDIFLFDDEEIFIGYLGGKLRGKTVACPGRNANTARKCGG